uniref:Transmembrane BAX inhibitor motif containing 1 n=1 Tax=Felis catus TaxID=9685 RepID=A0ABI7Z187_FELCA
SRIAFKCENTRITSGPRQPRARAHVRSAGGRGRDPGRTPAPPGGAPRPRPAGLDDGAGRGAPAQPRPGQRARCRTRRAGREAGSAPSERSGPGQGYDAEERAVSESFGPGEWDDRKVRHTFIRKVYSIISIQLLVTVAIIAIFTFVKPVGDFVRRNLFVYYVSYAVFLGTYLTLACCQGPRRRFPWNIILLTLFTLAMGFMTGTISSVYETKAVIIAMIITAVVSISVTIFCFQTKVDFTSCTGLFCVLGIVMMVTGIVTAIVLSFKYIYWLHMVYAALGAICFTLFLAYDTQLVLGNRKHTISPEDYITGALQIYTDIIYIFTFVLQLMGDRN